MPTDPTGFIPTHPAPSKSSVDALASEAEREGIDAAAFRRRWVVLAAMCTSLLAVMLANSSLNLALPQMTTELEMTTTEQTWLVDLYSLLFAALLFTSGAVSDRYGRKLLLQIGLVIFTVASAYAGWVASSGVEAIAARGLMGVGAALVMPSTLSVLNTVFPRSQRASAIGIWTAFAGVGAGLGVIVGGVLLEGFGWESVFILSVVFGVVSLVANQVLTPESRDEHRTPIDWTGGVLSTVGMLGLVYAIIEGPSHGWTSWDVLLGAAGALLGIGAFVAWERRVPNPMLDLRLFQNPLFTVSAVAALIAFFALSGATFLLAQIFQLVLGMGILESALKMLPILVPILVLSPLASKLWSTWGARYTVGAGLIVIALGFGIASTWTSQSSYLDVVLPLVVVVAGMAFVMTPATILITASVPKNRSGMGAAMNDTIRELGAALGIAVLGSVIAAGYSASIADDLGGLPAPLADAAEKSYAVALQGVVPQLDAAAGQALVAAASDAWIGGLTTALLVSAGLAALAALTAFVFLPGRRDEQQFLALGNESHVPPAEPTVVATRPGPAASDEL